MTPFFIFLLKSAICLGVLMGYYLLVLKNKKMHGFNRWYLLGSAIVSVLLPLLHINLVQVSEQSARSFPILEVMGTGTTEEEAVVNSASPVNWAGMAGYVYLLVSVIVLAGTAMRIGWVYAMRRKYGAIRMNGYKMVNTSLGSAPFSFGNTLFWKEGIDIASQEGTNILVHELTHIRQHHTVDKLLLQLLLACCWLNPFLWLLRKELWLQHEFIADSQAIAEGDTESFARMLLQVQVSTTSIPVINSFFHSPIKRRLMMLNTSKQTTFSRVRRLLVAPLLMLTLFMFSFTIEKKNVNRAEKKILMVLDAAHGGKDAGGKGMNGEKEKDLALKICRKMMALSSEYNIEIIPTREDDAYPTLQERIDKSNSTEADLFLSVHLNKSTEENPRGNDYELGVCRRNCMYAEGIKLASAIVPRLQSLNINAAVVDQSSIIVLRENKRNAILLECGNMDDPENIARLADDVQLEAMCRAVLSGIVDYEAK